MHTILIVIHLLIVIALVGVVLVQRSEGGGLGIGGGSGFMTARGAANTLTRATAILAGLFFITSLALGILARYGAGPTSVLDRIPTQQQQQQNSGGTLLDQLNNSVPNKSGNGAEKAPAAQGSTAQPPASGQGNSGSQPPSGSEAAPTAAPATNGATATPPANGQGGGNGTGIPTGQ